MAMYALVITFDSAAALADLEQPFTEFAEGLKQVDGFIMKTWLVRDATLGGFYLFDSQSSAERYLEEMFNPVVASNAAFSSLQINGYDVHEGFSAMTGTPGAMESDARAVAAGS